MANDGIHRRSFLIGASATVGALAQAGRAATAAGQGEDVSSKWTEALSGGRDYPIQAKPFWQVSLKDNFWKPKVETNATVTIPFEIEKIKDSARGLQAGVLQAAMFTLQTRPDPLLQAYVDSRVGDLLAHPVRGNGGFEIATTHFTATGKRALLDQAIAEADRLAREFQEKDPPFSGGERDALNCVHLYRVTGDKKHLALAKHYLDIRGREDSVGRSRHNQSYKPVVEQAEAVGHAVNAVTLMLSMLEVAVLTGIPTYAAAAERMWRDAAERKLYLTGGVGSTGNEGFGQPYSLPNLSAYAETCAVLMFMTLNHRLFLATGDSKYIDVLERGMYNNALSGVSQSGDHFFYVNRLASAGDGRDARWQQASLECCPPNLVRFLASMPGFIYAQDRSGGIYVNLYVASDSSFDVAGRKVSLSVESGMPWKGSSTITIGASEPVRTTLRLRIPGWARNRPDPGGLYSYSEGSAGAPTLKVNGHAHAVRPDANGYVVLSRTWSAGDKIELSLPLEARRVTADPRIREAGRRVAVERGPIVYCAEWPYVPDGEALDLLLPAESKLTASFDPKLYGGVTVIGASARRVSKPDAPAAPLKLVPYYLWANKGPGQMNVWLASAEYEPGDIGPAGGFIFHRNPHYVRDGWRYLEAAPFDQSHGAQWGCFRREIPGARGDAIGTGKQNTADILAACSEPATAAHVCASFKLNGIRGWFLPSRDELVEMYRVLKATGAADFRDSGLTDNVQYWASTQNDADMAAHVGFADAGRKHGDDKDFPRRVRAIRAI